MMGQCARSVDELCEWLRPDQQLLLDSRHVQRGDIFVAIAGRDRHGLDFLNAVLQREPSALLVDAADPRTAALEAEYLAEQGCQLYLLESLDRQLGALARAYYGAPPRTIAVTGTDGKSSISHFVAQLFSLLGKPCGVVGTLGYGLPDQPLTPLINTTPDPLSLFNIGRELRARGCELMAIEASSHALDQNRLSGLAVETAVLSNLGRDHLDYHQSVAHYAKSKAQLFFRQELNSVVLNHDEPFGRALAQVAKARGVRCLNYGLESGFALDLRASELTLSAQGAHFVLQYHDQRQRVSLPLIGRFNVNNALAAVASLLSHGEDFSAIAACLPKLSSVPGRVERFGGQGEQPLVLVDYAHTPLALASVLHSVRQQTAGRLLCVFGCGGDRDRGKRPLMAQAAERLADVLVLTDDNPRSESPAKIIGAMRAGLSGSTPYQVIHDRRAAIAYAIEQAGANDTVLVAGKGHESEQIVGTQVIAFSDRDVVSTLLSQIKT